MKKLARPLLKPEVLRAMTVSATKKRAAAKRAKIAREPGEMFADLPILAIPQEAKIAVDYFAVKMVKALHFKHTQKVVPAGALIKHRWFTNFNQIEGKIPPEIFAIPTGIPSLTRTKVDLSDQFNYLYVVSEDGTLGVYTVEFRQSFCIFAMVSFNPAAWDTLDHEEDLPDS